MKNDRRLTVPEQNYGKLTDDQKYQQWKTDTLTTKMPKSVFEALLKQHKKVEVRE